jgi:ketosteroid isomerase-like protein
MSQENVEVVRTTIAAFNRRDFAAWLRAAHPEIEVHPVTAEVEGGTRGLRP